MKRRKKILMASANHWTSSFQVGTHHLARGFVEAGWDVAFVSAPISPLHLLGGINQELHERFAIYRSGGYYDRGGHLWTYVPVALLAPHNKPLLRTGWVHRHWASLTWPNVVRKVTRAGFGEVDLLYFDSIHQLFWLNSITHKKSLLRVADRNTGFERSTPAAQELEHELVQSVDIVIYTAEQLKEYVESMKPKRMLHVPNGVNFKHFAGRPKSLAPEYKDIPRPIAIYVGAIDVWFNYKLMNRVAQELPDVSFVLIGSDELARAKLKKLPNIHILGRRKYGDLPAYLHNADVGIIPFDVAGHPELVHGINPLKLYEYLACGLPVVSVEWEELKNIKSPAILCQTTDQFVQGIADAVKQPHDREVYIQYAAGQDWSSRIKTISEFLGIERV